MKNTTKKRAALNRQRERHQRQRMKARLRRRPGQVAKRPVIRAAKVAYEVAHDLRGVGAAGIAAMRQLVHRLRLPSAINRALGLFQRHTPYWESDHVLNIAFSHLAGAECLEDIKRLRWDEGYLDALGAERLPDATTAGDFCRRFEAEDIETLMAVINRKRVQVWREQPGSFFEEAVIDADGTLAEVTGERKEGMAMSYKGIWSYHPLLVSLANTGEPLYLVNRSGNRPSSEGAAERLDQAIELCRGAGFKRCLLRGDTDFSQTRHLDRWSAQADVSFVFGMDCSAALQRRAEALAPSAWTRLERPPKYQRRGAQRERRPNYKERIVKEREYKNIRLDSEDVAEFTYSPTACKREYRVVVVRKNLSVERGESALFDDIRYFFYITNETDLPASEVVFLANTRCNQENLIKQLKSEVRAMDMPSHDLVSNWAYMVIASLAWTLKAWFALALPETGRWARQRSAEKQQLLRMTFSNFVNSLMRIPGQLVTTARRTVVRLTAWNHWQPVLLRAVDALARPLRP